MIPQKELNEQVDLLMDLIESIGKNKDRIEYLEEIQDTLNLELAKTQLAAAENKAALVINAISRRIDGLDAEHRAKFETLIS